MAKVSSNKRSKVKPTRGTLMLIATLLISSAMLRAGLGAGQAIAREAKHDDQMAMPSGHSEMIEKKPLSCAPREDLAPMLKAFQTREERLKLREEQLRSRMQALAVADEEISKKFAALTKAEEELRSTLALADNAAEDDISRLVSVYENMKPKDAAALFEAMDPDFAAGFLGRMQPATAAGVMAGLPPEVAYTVSVILAGRNTKVPKN